MKNKIYSFMSTLLERIEEEGKSALVKLVWLWKMERKKNSQFLLEA